MLTRLSK